MLSALPIATPPSEKHPLRDSLQSSSPPSVRETSLQNSPLLTQHSESQLERCAETTSASSTQHTGLSPRRVQSLPRAWERRPATPYVPRNDAQKIWKRVPLSVVGTGEGQKWRKETDKLNTRPVKRLRISHLGEEADKENVDYAASKWEEDGLATPSPKRKAVECGVRPEPGITAEGQNIPVLTESDDDVDENDELDEFTFATSSPELGTPTAHGLPEEQRPIEDEEAISATTLDKIVTSVERNDLTTSPTSVAHSSAGLVSPSATVSPTRRTMKLLSTEDESYKNQKQDEVAVSHETLPSVDNINADEDTAFLYAFLFRTRARKEAKEQYDHVVVPSGPVDAFDMVSNELAYPRLQGASAETPERDEAPSDLSQATEASITLSPRRSSRFATRLPRAQKAASHPKTTIPLKRVNGSEVAADIRKNQSIAVATRMNTRCNKFGYIPVKIRLIQLAAEAKVRVTSGASAEACQTSDQESNVGRQGKKQKEICWSETLATYQDGSEPLKNSSVLEEMLVDEQVSQNEETAAEADLDAKPEDEPTQETLADQSMQSLVQLLHEKSSSNSSSVKKVRRLRRLNGGSVNGTPAPEKFTGTLLPVPVGSKIPTYGSSSVEPEKPKRTGIAASRSNPPEATRTKEGVQTRTRSKNASSV